MGAITSQITPKPWEYGDADPKYNDGEPERMDFSTKDGIPIAAYCWPSDPERARQRHGTARPSVILVHGNDSHTRFDWLVHSTDYTDEEIEEMLQKEALERHERGEPDPPPIGRNQWSKDNSSSRKFRPMKYFVPRFEGSWIQEFNREGYNVYGMDFQSYGLSGSHFGNMREVFRSFDDLVADLLQFRHEIQVHSQHTSSSDPIFLVGVSMGGCAAVRACQEAAHDTFTGAVLLAPMLSLESVKEEPSNKLLLPLLDGIATVFPTMRIGVASENVYFPEEDVLSKEDPIVVNGNTRAIVAKSLLDCVDKARQQMEYLRTPFITFHSVDDTMCDPEGSTFLYRHASSRDKTIRLLKTGMWHSLQHESGNRRVLAELLHWLNSRASTFSRPVSSSELIGIGLALQSEHAEQVEQGGSAIVPKVA